ncbi:PQQ-dependent sugar dehydrogenase [Pedosphaera parvula]|nr:sorbosone dehydrogenase family protein [Pedosphaera parvula]
MRANIILGLTSLFCLAMANTLLADTATAEGKPQENVSHVFQPERRDFTPERLKQLKLPPGFKVNVFAQGLGNPRMIAVGDDNTVYVTCLAQGSVVALRDKQDRGIADEQLTIVSDLKGVHGIAIHEGDMYLGTVRKIYKAHLLGGGKVEKPEPLKGPDLPEMGMHWKRTLGFGPDGMLYISMGSTCNSCEESNPENAAILRAKPDGTERKVFASGLRNTLGFDWHPETHELWGVDNGSDDRGDQVPPEELNLLVEGGFYGWPYCFGDKQVDALAPQPKGKTKEQICATSIAPVLTYTAHAAPIAMTFYTGKQFPPAYTNDAFVVWRGSWNRLPPSGYCVTRVHFEDNKPVKFEDFLTGFLIEDGKAQFARIAGIAMTRDGSLLVSDDENGIIYRVSYGNGKVPAESAHGSEAK